MSRSRDCVRVALPLDDAPDKTPVPAVEEEAGAEAAETETDDAPRVEPPLPPPPPSRLVLNPVPVPVPKTFCFCCGPLVVVVAAAVVPFRPPMDVDVGGEDGGGVVGGEGEAALSCASR